VLASNDLLVEATGVSSRVCLTNMKRGQMDSRESRFSVFCAWSGGYFGRFRSPRNGS